MAGKKKKVGFFKNLLPVFTCSFNYALPNSIPLLIDPSFTCSLHMQNLHNFCGFACIDLNTQTIFP